MKANIKQLVKAHIDLGLNIGILENEIATECAIPVSVCTVGELAELLDLIPDEAIRQAVEDEEADKVREAQADFRHSGSHW